MVFVDLSTNGVAEFDTKSKVLKILENDALSILIAKIIDSTPITHFMIQKCLKYIRFHICSILTNRIRIRSGNSIGSNFTI